MSVKEINQDIADCKEAIKKLEYDLTLPGLSEHGIYAINNQISWNVGQISYLGSVIDDFE